VWRIRFHVGIVRQPSIITLATSSLPHPDLAAAAAAAAAASAAA